MTVIRARWRWLDHGVSSRATAADRPHRCTLPTDFAQITRRAAIAVLAVKATRFASGFAGLDRCARRWLWLTMSFGERSRPFGRDANQKDMDASTLPRRRRAQSPEGP